MMDTHLWSCELWVALGWHSYIGRPYYSRSQLRTPMGAFFWTLSVQHLPACRKENDNPHILFLNHKTTIHNAKIDLLAP